MASSNGEKKMAMVKNGEEMAKELKMVTMKIRGAKFEVDEEAVNKWKTTRRTEFIEEDGELSIFMMSKFAFSKIIEYRKMQLAFSSSSEELNEWVISFVDNLDASELLGFLYGAFLLEEGELLVTLFKIFTDKFKNLPPGSVVFKSE